MKKTILLSIFIFGTLISKAQDPVFYNSNQSLIYLNPSFAGSNGGLRNQFSYKNQWPSLSGKYVTFLNAFDLYIKAIRGGLAVSVIQDNQANGLLKTTGASLAYAQHISFLDGDLKIIPSLQVAYGQRDLNTTALNFGDMIDPRLGLVWTNSITPSSKITYADFSAGLLVNYKNKLFIGTSIFHMNEPDAGLLSSYKLPFNFNLHASYNFQLSEKSQVQAFYVFNGQNNFWTNRLGLNFVSFNHLVTGIGLVSLDTPILSAGYRNDYFNLLLGYDFTLSKLAGNTGGTWEFQASFNLRNKEQRKALTGFETW
jgi:type IX secretion system PorP/SprF family membrane protein